MKYRIVEVTPPDNAGVYYEVEVDVWRDVYNERFIRQCEWKFQAKFNTISACQQYIQNQAPPNRKVISEIEV